MRVNPRVFDERMDMLNGIQIPNPMPKDLKTVAERILNMVTRVGYTPPNEQTVTELDKILTVEYWEEYDGLRTIMPTNEFAKWFISKATEPELISRARRWLVEHNYILIRPEVMKRAMGAEQTFSSTIKGAGR